MDLKQLTSLLAIADIGSVTQAARALRTVQPAVSRHVRSLEEELGVALFERTRHGMKPTPAGEIVIEHARRALLELDRARAAVRPDSEGATGIVAVGLLESTVGVLAAPLVASLAERHPGVELRLLSAFSGHLRSRLDHAELDLTLLYDLESTPSTAVVPLLEEPLWAVGPPGAMPNGGEVTWDELSRRELVLPIAGHGLRVLIDRALDEVGAQPIVACQTDAMNLQKSLVAAGRGWTVLPASGVGADVAHRRLSGGPVVAPAVTRTVVIALRRDSRTPHAVQTVAAELVRIARGLVRDGRWPASLPLGQD